MNSRFFTMLIIALILAIGAALLAKRWVESQTGEAPANAQQSTVLVKVANQYPIRHPNRKNPDQIDTLAQEQCAGPGDHRRRVQ